MPNLTADTTRARRPIPDTLAARVRERTLHAHRETENRPFIVALMRGELDLAAYTRYLAQLSYVYEALEARPAQPDDPEILDPRLDRGAAIRSDLANLGVADRDAEHPALASTRAYADRVAGLPATDLPAYLAHHYTRYLGDLSGGQAIAALVARHYSAADEQLSYYRFDGIRTVPYKRGYRAALDGLGFDDGQSQRFIDETVRAFAYNAALFDELAGKNS